MSSTGHHAESPSGVQTRLNSSAAPATSAAGLASVLANRYQLSSLLGTGGMGTVFRARDLELDEEIALKVLNLESVDSKEALDRFKAEVRLARRVTHPNVARTYDFGTDGALCFLTMELVDGVSLAERMGARPRLLAQEVVDITRGVLHGLQAAHRAGVLHRDLKPGNIMLARDGRVLLMDFGIARALSADGSDRRTKNNLLGTPLYMSPEQVEGSLALDGRSDLYSLGLIVHEMLTGRVPFDGGSPFSIAAARLIKPAPKLEETSVPCWFAALVDRLLVVKREERFDDAAAVLAEFHDHDQERVKPSAPAAVFVEASTAAPLRVAVMQLSAPLGHRHVASSLTDDLADSLASTPRIQVIVGAPFERESAREAARHLGTELMVEGRLTPQDRDHYELRLRLLTVNEGLMVHATSTTGALSEIARWLQTATCALATSLETKLPQHPSPVTDATTLDFYYRGRAEFHVRWPSSAAEARKQLSQAYERAPDDPQVVGSYALVLTRTLGFQGADDNELARRMVERARALGGSRPSALMASISYAFQLNDITRCAELLSELLERNPQHGDGLEALARLRCEVGPLHEAERVLHLAWHSDRTLLSVPADLTRMAVLRGQPAEAERYLQQLKDSGVPLGLPLFIRARYIHVWGKDNRTPPTIVEAAADGSLNASEQSIIATLLGFFESPQMRLHGVPTADEDPQYQIEPSPMRPRRVLYRDQLRTEGLMMQGRHDEALTVLERLDAFGLLDVLWLEHLALFEPLRTEPRFQRVLTHTEARAQAVRALLPHVGEWPGRGSPRPELRTGS